MKKIFKLIVIFSVLCVGLNACHRRSKPDSEQNSTIAHEVKLQGESLGVIAAWYTQDSKNWKLIKEANPKIDPNRINIGDIIKVPTALIKNTNINNQELKQGPTKDFIKRYWASRPNTNSEKKKDLESQSDKRNSLIANNSSPYLPATAKVDVTPNFNRQAEANAAALQIVPTPESTIQTQKEINNTNQVRDDQLSEQTRQGKSRDELLKELLVD